MKAAAEAWGGNTEDFGRGFAKQTDDPEIVAATMAKPGVVLKRPVGSNGRFSEHAKLPRISLRKSRSAQQSLSARKIGNQRRSAIKPLARPCLHSSGSISGARRRVGEKRLPGRRSSEGVGRQSQRQSERLTLPRAATPRSPKGSSASALQ